MANVVRGKSDNLQALAEFKTLSIPLYYASIYQDSQVTAPVQYLDNRANRSLEYRFIADQHSARTFSRIFLERIMANNDRSHLSHYAEDIQQLVQLLRHSYKTGDRIQVHYTPNAAIIVTINNTEVARFEKTGLFNILINAWLGENLSSETFYRELTGPVMPDTLSNFRALKLEQQRQVWAASLQPQVEANQEVASASVPPTKTTSSKKTKKKVEPVKPKEPVTRTAIDSVADKIAEKPNIEPRQSTPEVHETVTTVQQSVVDTPSQQPILTDEQKTAIDTLLTNLELEFAEELKESIHRKTNLRPPLRLRKIGKQDLLVSITVDASGAVSNITMKDNPHGELMAEHALEELNKLDSLPQLPKLLEKKNYTVDINFNFAKCKRTPSAWLCF